jgi:hypothetical protein
MNTKRLLCLAVAAATACTFDATAMASQATGSDASQSNKQVYVAQLKPMNSKVTGDQTSGQARLTVNGDSLTIRIHVKHAPPDMAHWQHFHGFTDGDAAACPTSDADANGDGIIDLIETESASGTTMVPFDSQPAAMDVAHGDYPKANADGSYIYRKTVSLAALKAAFGKAFDGAKLDLGKRVVYIHGVPKSTNLPDTVASLGPIPAHVTLPIACGKLEPVRTAH